MKQSNFNNVDELKEYLCEQGYEEAIIFIGPDYLDAVIGVSSEGCVIYNYEKMIQCLMAEDGMSSEEALNS